MEDIDKGDEPVEGSKSQETAEYHKALDVWHRSRPTRQDGQSDEDYRQLEIKWLAQGPTAPPAPKRTRRVGKGTEGAAAASSNAAAAAGSSQQQG